MKNDAYGFLVKTTRRVGTLTNVHFNIREYDLSLGTLSIISVERLRQRQQTQQRRRRQKKQQKRRMSALPDASVPPESMDVVDKEAETRICFVPRSELPRQGFQAIMRQYSDDRGTFNTVPRLLVNNILPLGSRVFSLVRYGRVSEFQEMLRLGTASLRDQDEFGASLLFVSYYQKRH